MNSPQPSQNSPFKNDSEDKADYRVKHKIIYMVVNKHGRWYFSIILVIFGKVLRNLKIRIAKMSSISTPCVLSNLLVLLSLFVTLKVKMLKASPGKSTIVSVATINTFFFFL